MGRPKKKVTILRDNVKTPSFFWGKDNSQLIEHCALLGLRNWPVWHIMKMRHYLVKKGAEAANVVRMSCNRCPYRNHSGNPLGRCGSTLAERASKIELSRALDKYKKVLFPKKGD